MTDTTNIAPDDDGGENPISNSEGLTPELTKKQFFAQLEDFDASELPGPWTVKGNVNISTPTLDALAPEARERIRAELNSRPHMDRETLTTQLIRTELQNSSIGFKVRTTLGEGSSELSNEYAAIEYEIAEAESKSRRLAVKLDEKKTIVDPATGKMVETDDYVITGHKRELMGQELVSLFKRTEEMANGSEGKRRIEAARERDWTTYKDREQSSWEAQEVERRAVQIAQDERINKRAETKAKFLKGPTER